MGGRREGVRLKAPIKTPSCYGEGTARVLKKRKPNHQYLVCKMEAQLECVHVADTFLYVWLRFVCSVGA